MYQSLENQTRLSDVTPIGREEKTTGMIKIPHLVFVPGRSLKLYGVVGQHENNGQTVPPIECIR